MIAGCIYCMNNFNNGFNVILSKTMYYKYSKIKFIVIFQTKHQIENKFVTFFKSVKKVLH